MPTYEGRISTKWIGNAKRECIRCGVHITNLEEQVGEIRTRYGAKGHGQREIICMECHMRYARETLGRVGSSRAVEQPGSSPGS